MGVQQLLDVARGELGTREEPAGSNLCKYGAWYGMNGSAWCAMFVSWCAATSGNGDLIPRHAYTPAGADWFRARGNWESQPRAGSIAFYDISGIGRISHVGIVESVLPDGRWYSIEGNTSAAGGRTGGEVRRQLRSTVGTSRGGFGRPRWTTQPAASWPPWSAPLLRRGNAGDRVRAAQGALSRHLAADGRPGIAVDGEFGPATLAAVSWFQQRSRLEVDGIIGPNTWRALGA